MVRTKSIPYSVRSLARDLATTLELEEEYLQEIAKLKAELDITRKLLAKADEKIRMLMARDEAALQFAQCIMMSHEVDSLADTVEFNVVEME